MRPKFSARFGIARPSDLIDHEIPPRMRTRLWNTFQHFYITDPDYAGYQPTTGEFVSAFAMNISDQILTSSIPRTQKTMRKYLADWFFQAKWYEVYDFIEFASLSDGPVWFDNRSEVLRAFRKIVDRVLFEEGSAYQLRDGEIIRRLDELEYAEIDPALNFAAPFSPVS